MAAERPRCRGCGRTYSGDGRAFLRAVTYEPATHTYLCRACPKPRIVMTCRSCGAIRELTPGEARSIAKAAPAGRWEIDFELRTGTFQCNPCSASSLLHDYHDRMRKRFGRASAATRQAAGLTRWRTDRPDAAAHQHATAVAASADARRGRRVELTERQRALWGLANLELDPKGRFSLCSLCGRLVWSWDSLLRRYPALHNRCILAWRRKGKHRPGTSPPPARRRTRGDNDDELRALYATTVHFFRITYGDPSLHHNRLAARGDDGQVLSVAALAKQLGIQRQQLYWRVDRFLSLLPDEETATGPLKKWRRIFRTLQPAPEDAPGNI